VNENRPAIGRHLQSAPSQVKNGEIAVFRFIGPELPLFAGGGTDISRKSFPRRTPSHSAMRAVLDIVLIVLDLYVWLLIAAAILSC